MVIAAVMLASSVLVAAHVSQEKPGDWARYAFVTIKNDAKPSVQEVTIRIGARENDLWWWEMTVKKPDGAAFAIRALSESVPMTGSHIGRVERYLFKDGERPFLDYRDKTTSSPLLPDFDFKSHLIPCPVPESTFQGNFATTGTFIGNCIQLMETGQGETLDDGEEVKAVDLDPNLIVGTGRGFRDVDEGRVTGRDYNYRPFLPEEYDEMEEAGMSFFRANTKESASWVNERPVFYTQYPSFEDYPNILYRSNYLGPIMFTDEPAILTNFSRCQRPADAANLLRMTVAESVKGSDHYSPDVLARHLKNAGVYFGCWELLQRDIPAWEAVFAAAFHEMEGGVSGVYHEGRYNLEVFNEVLKNFLGLELELTSEEMLRIHYAFLRGAARCFDGYWGMSIYGQADPGISPSAVRTAYDMGARYIWFWTCDHGHHLPYREQLELASVLREHEKTSPREDMSSLLRAAKAVVVFPEGYIGWSEFWKN